MKIPSARITIIDTGEQFILSYSDGTNTIRAKVKANAGKFSVGTIQIYDPNSKNLPFQDDDQADEIKFDINVFLQTVSEPLTAFISSGKNGESKEITEGNEMKGQFEGIAKEQYIGFVKKLMEAAGDKDLESAVIGGFETIFEASIEHDTLHIFDVLDENGWVSYGSFDKNDITYFYIQSKDKTSIPYDALKSILIADYGDDVTFHTAKSEYAPELKKTVIGIRNFNVDSDGSNSVFEARERKTEDEYQIHGNYGSGWEEVTSEATMKEAKAQIKTYRENEKGIPFKIVYKRIKKAVTEGIETVSDQPVVFVKVTFDDGHFLKTSINGDLESANQYYLGKDFTFGTGEDDEVTKKAVDVELAD